MRGTPTKGHRLGGSAQHERRILANLVCQMVAAESVTTTQAKAKALRPVIEKTITKARRGDLHAKRQIMALVGDRETVARLVDDIAPRYADRNGGYTRIRKLGERRKGDNAPMARIEFV